MKVIKILTVICVVTTILSCNNYTVKNKPLKTEVDSVSYAIGLDMASKLKVNFEEVDADILVQGFISGIDSSNLLIEKTAVDKILSSYFMKKREEFIQKQNEERLKKAEEQFSGVKQDGIKFLEENKTKKGVQVTESGLQYIVIKEGKGKKPAANSRVKVHYHGTTPEGEVFDSSKEKGNPVEFNLDRVIKGWTEGLQLMNEGAVYKFFIPQELAYGVKAPQGGNGPIKPFMPLVFEVELIKIVETK